MESRLRLACRATSRSQRWRPKAAAMRASWPRPRRSRAQRRAVTRFPERDPGGAGVTMRTLTAAGIPQTAQVRNPVSTSRRSGVWKFRYPVRIRRARVVQQPPRMTFRVSKQGSEYSL